LLAFDLATFHHEPRAVFDTVAVSIFGLAWHAHGRIKLGFHAVLLNGSRVGGIADTVVEHVGTVRRVSFALALVVWAFADNASLQFAVGVVPPRWISVVEANNKARLFPFTFVVSARIWFMELGTPCFCRHALGPVGVSDLGSIKPGEPVAWTFDADGVVISFGARPESVTVVLHRVQNVFDLLFGSNGRNFAATLLAKVFGFVKGVPERVSKVFEVPLAFWMVPLVKGSSLVHHEREANAVLGSFDSDGFGCCCGD